MEDRYIHKNLDTSFVNLSALIKYLRRRQFIGTVNVELNGYRAEVSLGVDNAVRVYENDEISGREAQGEEALQRLLIRSREPGGRINVVQIVGEPHTAPAEEYLGINSNESFSPEADVIPKPVEELKPTPAESFDFQHELRFSETTTSAAPKQAMQHAETASTSTNNAPDFPFSLSNKFEEKAQEVLSSPGDWQTLLKLTVELLTVVDRSLAVANLNFTNEFRKVCTEIADDYPFLNPNSDVFEYHNGKIKMHDQMNAKMFISGISESLRRIMIKLSRSSKYSETYLATSERLQTVIQKRNGYYEKYDVAHQVGRIVSP